MNHITDSKIKVFPSIHLFKNIFTQKKKKKFSIYLITMEIQTVYITALPLLQN